MALLLVLTPETAWQNVVPSLELLPYRVQRAPAETAGLLTLPDADALLIDARANLVAARALCRLARTTQSTAPVIAVLNEGGLPALSPEWSIDDVLLSTAGPAEIDARLRLAMARTGASAEPSRVQTSGITIDEQSYAAKANGRPLDLTYKEFQLLHFLAAHPSRVFTREQLLTEVWGFDYFGGTRTVDVHVRRLRAKLGDQEHVIGTVRNVGYRFNADDESASD